MSLRKEYLRKSGEILGSVTSGFSDGSNVVRDKNDKIAGTTSDKFHTVRDSGRVVATNTSDPGILIKRKR